MTKLYIFDADGTLRRCTVENQPCPNKPGEWALLPGVRERLSLIDWGSSMAAIASNQGGVGLGLISEDIARGLLLDLTIAAFPQPKFPTDGAIWPVFMCPHRPDAGCHCRKPKPGLLEDACAYWGGIEPSEALMVGDMEGDKLAAEAAGIPFQWAADFFNWR